MSSLVGRRIRFRHGRSGLISVGYVERHFTKPAARTDPAAGGAEVVEYVRVREPLGRGVTYVNVRGSNVLAVCDIRPKNWRRQRIETLREALS